MNGQCAVLHVFEPVWTRNVQGVPALGGVECFKHDLMAPADDLEMVTFDSTLSRNDRFPNIVEVVPVGGERCGDVNFKRINDFESETDRVLASVLVVHLLRDDIDSWVFVEKR